MTSTKLCDSPAMQLMPQKLCGNEAAWCPDCRQVWMPVRSDCPDLSPKTAARRVHSLKHARPNTTPAAGIFPWCKRRWPNAKQNLWEKAKNKSCSLTPFPSGPAQGESRETIRRGKCPDTNIFFSHSKSEKDKRHQWPEEGCFVWLDKWLPPLLVWKNVNSKNRLPARTLNISWRNRNVSASQLTEKDHPTKNIRSIDCKERELKNRRHQIRELHIKSLK